GDAGGTPGAASGSTLSLYPGATREEIIRLVAVFSLFAVVRGAGDAGASLRRLSVAAVANGALLALFALVQFVTSRHDLLYWSYPTRGLGFGPFICRNHFAFYMNLCVGLGLGLLLGPPLGGGSPDPPPTRVTVPAGQGRTRLRRGIPPMARGPNVLR